MTTAVVDVETPDRAESLGRETAPEPRQPVSCSRTSAAVERLVSIDAYRGLTMILMISAGLRIAEVVRSFDTNPALHHLKTPLWERLAYQTDHAPWVGCSLW